MERVGVAAWRHVRSGVIRAFVAVDNNRSLPTNCATLGLNV